MKTHFTSADIGKTFATSQQGVTATLKDYRTHVVTNDCRFKWAYSNNSIAYTNEYGIIPYGGGNFKKLHVHPDKEIPSEADLLRKEIEELKASHEADLRTAVEMARKNTHELDPVYWYYTPDEIIEKILKK